MTETKKSKTQPEMRIVLRAEQDDMIISWIPSGFAGKWIQKVCL